MKRVVTPSARSRWWHRFSAATRDASLGGKQNLMGRWPHLHHHDQPHNADRSAFACKVSHAYSGWPVQHVLGTSCPALKRRCPRESSPPYILVVRQDDQHFVGAGAHIEAELDAIPKAVLVATPRVAALVHSVLQTNEGQHKSGSCSLPDAPPPKNPSTLNTHQTPNSTAPTINTNA